MTTETKRKWHNFDGLACSCTNGRHKSGYADANHLNALEACADALRGICDVPKHNAGMWTPMQEPLRDGAAALARLDELR